MVEGYMLIAEIEGMTIEEAKLSYAERKDLPSSAFCGPDRSYPASDAKHVRAGLQRLSQFWGKISPSVRMKIYRCLLRRAKRFGVEVDKQKFEETVGEAIPEDSMNKEAITDWYLKQIGIA
jgi:hypothetical protein